MVIGTFSNVWIFAHRKYILFWPLRLNLSNLYVSNHYLTSTKVFVMQISAWSGRRAEKYRGRDELLVQWFAAPSSGRFGRDSGGVYGFWPRLILASKKALISTPIIGGQNQSFDFLFQLFSTNKCRLIWTFNKWKINL